MNNSNKKFLHLNLANIKKIPFTILFCTIFAILFSIKGLFQNQYISYKIVYFSILSGLIMVNVLFTEVLFTDKRKKMIGFILSVMIAIILSLVGFSSLLFRLDCNTASCPIDVSDRMLYFTLCYIISVVSASIFVIYKKSKLNFYEYCNIALNNLFKTIVVYIISLVCLSFVFILLDSVTDVNYKISGLIYSLLFGLYVLPNFIISFIDTNNKINSIYKGIGLFCILPLAIICTFIIYFYIVKLLIIRELPDNLIFTLVLFVFIFGMISYFVSKNIDNKFTRIYCNIFPYIFILPVLLQSYSLFVRVSEYGLTPDRYISFMIVVFELIVLFLLVYKKGIKLENILISIIIICIIISVSPFNLIKLSNVSQQSILNKNYNKSGEDYYKAISAYEYLINSENGKKYIDDEINEKLKNEVFDKKYTDNYKSYYFNNDLSKIDISEYKTLKKINFSYTDSKDDIKNIEILNKNSKNIEANIDLNKYIDYLISNDYLTDKMFELNNIIEIDDNTIIYLDYLYFRVSNSKDKTITNLRSTGYLFEK